MISAEVLVEASWEIRVIVRDGSCPTREFIAELTEVDRKKIWALLDRTSKHDPPQNEEKFKKLKGPIMEFKSFQDRLLCFFAGPRSIVITHGCKKKRDRASPEEIARAERFMEEFLTSRAQYRASRRASRTPGVHRP